MKILGMLFIFLVVRIISFFFYLLIRNNQTDLPSYKELFPSHLDLTHTTNEPLPSYDDCLQTLVIPHSTTSLPVSTLSSQSSTDPPRCIWITDRTRRPLCIRGTVTYV